MTSGCLQDTLNRKMVEFHPCMFLKAHSTPFPCVIHNKMSSNFIFITRLFIKPTALMVHWSDWLTKNNKKIIGSILIMDWGNALEEYFGFRRVNIAINPSRPCCHPFIISHESIHIFVSFSSFTYVIPPEFE